MSYNQRVFVVAFAFLCILIGILISAGDSRAEKFSYWITVDNAELTQIRNELGDDQASLKEAEVRSIRSGIAILRLSEPQMEALSRSMHGEYHKCSGYIAHPSEAEAIDWIDRGASVDAQQQFITYTIDNQGVVNPMVAAASEPQNRQVIIDLSAFPNRRYNQTSGIDSANWIKNKWTALAAGRNDVTVEFYNHPTATSPQPSIIMTVQGTTLPDEIVVLGGHQDSLNGGGPTLPAPGADDDASGIACLTETIRVMMVTGFRPNRTVKFMAYAAEEVGLRGSNAIATDYRAQNKNVVGVMQFDMTNYKGVLGNDIVIFQDYTNAAQNQFVRDLITTYQPTLVIGTSSCGYGCSDHASWHNKSYPASLPFESTFNDDNNTIHTANDTIAVSNNNANHALKFTKLALSFVGELAKGSFAVTRRSPTDFDGDGKTDPSVYRPSAGDWYLLNSTTGFRALHFGLPSDIMVPADYTGDGKTDMAVWRPSDSIWYVLRSEDNTFYGAGFGANGDTPAPGDYDGDGKADLVVMRPGAQQSYWYLQQSTAGFAVVPFGLAGDLPTLGDYDGDGKNDVAVYRPSAGAWFRFNSSNGTFLGIGFGTTGDKVVPADYTGDGKTDLAVFRPSNNIWFLLRSEDNSLTGGAFGASGDLPSPGDYDGDGKADLAVYRLGATPGAQSVFYVLQTTAGFNTIPWGLAEDRPVPGAYVY